MSALPENYNLDYLVYSASNSFTEQKELWNTDYLEVFKLMMFKKFDNYVDYEIGEWYKHGGQS